MKNFNHYRRGYYMPPVQCTNWVNKEYVDKAPIWCSVDLRDGNQNMNSAADLLRITLFLTMLLSRFLHRPESIS